MSDPGGLPRPIPNSYWVREGRFAAGEYPGAKDPEEAAVRVKVLVGARIDCFIDLTDWRDHMEPYEHIAQKLAWDRGRSPRRESHPIKDRSLPRSKVDMSQILDAIDRALDQGRTVYVHCWGGTGRTGTVVGCWLVRHGLTGQGALDQIAQWWQGVEKIARVPRSPHTHEQREYVRNWTEPRAR